MIQISRLRFRTPGAPALGILVVAALIAQSLAAFGVARRSAPADMPPAPLEVLEAAAETEPEGDLTGPAGDPFAGIRAVMGLRAVVPPPPLPRATVAAAAPGVADISIFGGLGAWVDVYDFHLDVRRSVWDMARQGTRTLYIQTGRWNLPDAVHPQSLVWLEEAKRAGLRVVGWYLPGYGDLDQDLRRTRAIARAEAGGYRFDGIGIDIEWRREVPSLGEWNRRVAEHARLVREALGPAYPIAAITPSPVQMSVAPGYWAGFPWRDLAAVSDVIMTMSYWSYRGTCPAIQLHCAYQHTRADVEWARSYTDGQVPIHVIGGVGNRIGVAEVADFVRAASDAGAFGASLYDYDTTRAAYWEYLRLLQRL